MFSTSTSRLTFEASSNGEWTAISTAHYAGDPLSSTLDAKYVLTPLDSNRLRLRVITNVRQADDSCIQFFGGQRSRDREYMWDRDARLEYRPPCATLTIQSATSGPHPFRK